MNWHGMALATWLLVGGAEPAVDRLCVEKDGTLVVENDCGCNDALLCSSALIDKTLKVRVTTDPDRPLRCRACFPMVPGRCAIPAAANGRVEIIAGSLRLPIELVKGKPVKRACAGVPAR